MRIVKGCSVHLQQVLLFFYCGFWVFLAQSMACWSVPFCCFSESFCNETRLTEPVKSALKLHLKCSCWRSHARSAVVQPSASAGVWNSLHNQIGRRVMFTFLISSDECWTRLCSAWFAVAIVVLVELLCNLLPVFLLLSWWSGRCKDKLGLCN